MLQSQLFLQYFSGFAGLLNREACTAKLQRSMGQNGRQIFSRTQCAYAGVSFYPRSHAVAQYARRAGATPASLPIAERRDE